MNFSQAQINNPLPINCKTNFWTINTNGYIQQWDLSNSSVSGGDTILSGGGTSLSYCTYMNTPTFFSNNNAQVGISYYDPVSAWVTIPTYSAVNNNGGHLNDQYYMVEGAIIQVLKYWDGVNLITIDSLDGEFFAGTQDIAVDTLSQAWVFTGSTPSTVDSLKVYNQNGKINAYPIQFNEIAYGSFFLNDTLYLGTDQDSIFPVNISGSSAQLGNPIPFPANNYTDMASCQEAESTSSISIHPHSKVKILPNPTTGQLTLPIGIDASSISVYNSRGKLIDLKLSGQILDLSDQYPGLYFIKITNGGLASMHKVIKL